MKVRNIVNWRLIVLMTTVLTMAIYFTFAGGMNFYVNGKQVPTNQGQPFVQSGVTYVPLQASIKGMGGSYSYNSKSKTATIKAKGSKQSITITVGQNVAKIGKQTIPLKTKVVKKKKVNDNRKSQLVRNVLYVPVDFLQTQFKYPVTIKKVGKTTVLYIGAVPKPTPAPKPTPKPAPKPVTPAPKPVTPSVGVDKNAIVNSLVANGFYKQNADQLTLNPFNPGGSGYARVIVGFYSNTNFEIKILAWTDPAIPQNAVIPEKVKFALNTVIPSGANNIYSIVSATAVSGTHKDLNKSFSYNGLNTKVVFDARTPAVKVIFTK